MEIVDCCPLIVVSKLPFMNSYKELDVWKSSMSLIAEVYQSVKHYPKEEIYGLTSQTKRAAVSIAANIAEGVGRQYKKDTVQFLHIARGSLYELETLLIIAKDVNILDKEKFSSIEILWQKTTQLLNGFINYYLKSDLK